MIFNTLFSSFLFILWSVLLKILSDYSFTHRNITISKVLNKKLYNFNNGFNPIKHSIKEYHNITKLQSKPNYSSDTNVHHILYDRVWDTYSLRKTRIDLVGLLHCFSFWSYESLYALVFILVLMGWGWLLKLPFFPRTKS